MTVDADKGLFKAPRNREYVTPEGLGGEEGAASLNCEDKKEQFR